MTIDFDALRARLAGVGLNVSGVADGRPYQDILPGCRAVLVFASGGDALWRALLADLRAHPAHLTESTHPLDDFVQRALQAADPDPDPALRRWVRCAAEPEVFVDFRPLAHGAGLGWPSRMGLLLHPTYGLWTGLRAACFTTAELPLDAPRTDDGPCPACPAPCAAACPGDAFPEGQLKIGLCARFNATTDTCHGTCAARLACPVASAHRYSPLQLHYHYARGTGREALAQALAIAGDTRQGLDPRWASWATPE